MPEAPWANRIVGHELVPAKDLLAHPLNHRLHPHPQQAALAGSLRELGWIDEVIVNEVTQHVINGHLRVSLALREGEETPVPVKYVHLSPEEEHTALAVFDWITGMAAEDTEKLDALLRETTPSDAALQQLLSEMSQEAGIIAPQVEFKEYDESVEDEVEWQECPNCHHRWPK